MDKSALRHRGEVEGGPYHWAETPGVKGGALSINPKGGPTQRGDVRAENAVVDC